MGPLRFISSLAHWRSVCHNFWYFIRALKWKYNNDNNERAQFQLWYLSSEGRQVSIVSTNPLHQNRDVHAACPPLKTVTCAVLCAIFGALKSPGTNRRRSQRLMEHPEPGKLQVRSKRRAICSTTPRRVEPSGCCRFVLREQSKTPVR